MITGQLSFKLARNNLYDKTHRPVFIYSSEYSAENNLLFTLRLRQITRIKRMDHTSIAILLIFFSLHSLDGQYMSSKKDDPPPNIIFIMADDLGWNDVGFHGSNQIPTPNIDALAYNGLILNNYYVNPICTPSRSALMTGRYPIHTGMQHRVLYGAEPRGLPLGEVLLPQHLQRLGYSTHMIGKWHLGSFKLKYTPTFRGFESHIGFWTGHQDYFDHTAVEGQYWGLDMRRGADVAWDLKDHYSTRLFAQEAEKLIDSYNSSKPLFLYIAHAAVHSGNPYNPLPAPDTTVAKFNNIADYNRRRYAAMVSELDESVGRVVAALGNNNLLENSIIVFTTDNGGPANGFNLNSASNWPLRGTKNTLWEGGVRGAALLWSSKISSPGRVSTQLMHVTDWLPTLYYAAGGDITDLGKSLDGINLWQCLTDDLPSERKQVLHNIDDIYGVASLRVEEWKLVKGTTYNGDWDGWYGPSGNEDGEKYDIGQILGSKANKAISRVMRPVSPDNLRKIRQSAVVECRNSTPSNCKPLIEPCLFNIVNDPCERDNLAVRYQTVVQHLENILGSLNETAVPPGNLPWDPKGDPKYWNNTWTNFGDYDLVTNSL